MSAPLQSPPREPSTPVHSPDADGRFDLGLAIRESLATCDVSCKAAAYIMGLDPAQWTRQLHGDGHIPFDRIVQLPMPVQRALIERWARACDLSVVSADTKSENVRRLLRVCADVIAAHEGL